MLVCGLWPAASAISQPALLTKPLSLKECPGHGPLLPLKANVHELRLGLGGLYFDLEDRRRKARVTSRRRSNMLVVDG